MLLHTKQQVSVSSSWSPPSKCVRLTCGCGLVRAVESSVSTRRRADIHVKEDAILQSEDATTTTTAAATAFIWYEDGLFLTVCWLTSKRKENDIWQKTDICFGYFEVLGLWLGLLLWSCLMPTANTIDAIIIIITTISHISTTIIVVVIITSILVHLRLVVANVHPPWSRFLSLKRRSSLLLSSKYLLMVGTAGSLLVSGEHWR